MSDRPEGMFEQVLDAITDLVFVKGRGSRIVWANRAFLEANGMTNEEIEGTVDAPFIEPDDTLQYVKDDLAVFTTGRSLDIPSERITRHDGRVILAHTIKSALLGPDGAVVATVGVSRDITDRMDDYLTKPARPALVLEVLSALLAPRSIAVGVSF